MSPNDNRTFDPALTGSAENGIFGIAGSVADSALVYIPVPWEVTTSYGSGASLGPAAIVQASPQLDMHVRSVDKHYEKGFFLLEADREIVDLNARYKVVARNIQMTLESHGSLGQFPDQEQDLRAVNAASQQVNERVYRAAQHLDKQGKLVAVIGGDHSSPFGLIKFISEKFEGNFGVLHIDAHHDLRDSYQGFHFSHASIMKNVLDLPFPPASLVQVGIRDFSEQEAELAAERRAVHTFYDQDIKERLFEGVTFSQVVEEIIEVLPDNVYISFDIDGLQPHLCPNTGTPVAGGLSFEQASYLIKCVATSGRTVIGFDLCEVAPDSVNNADQWDGNVGARVLFLLSTWAMDSVKRASDR